MVEISKKVRTRVAPQSSAPVAHGVGRRKSAIARVWLVRGEGNVLVNGKTVDQYFDTDIARTTSTIACMLVPAARNYDVSVNVAGGGIYAQADAMKLGIARALVILHEDARGTLRAHKLLTVDARVKERKKYGQKAARRKFQFVKR